MVIHPSIGFNIPIVMIPNIGWMTIAHIPCFDDGTYHQGKVEDSGNHPPKWPSCVQIRGILPGLVMTNIAMV